MVEWDQTGLGQLSNGDYYRFQVERYGRRIMVQFGGINPDDEDEYLWRWEIIANPEDIATMTQVLAHTLRYAEANTEAVIAQLGEAKKSLERKLEGRE